MARFGGDAGRWVGPGTGLDDDGVAHKAKIVDQIFALHGTKNSDPVSLLAACGGRELAAIAGAVLAARMRSIPVMLDGFISSAAAAALTAGDKLDVLDHCEISHMSAEPGHLRLAVALRKQPVVDLGMRLGEGSGAATATLLVRGYRNAQWHGHLCRSWRQHSLMAPRPSDPEACALSLRTALPPFFC